MPVVASGNIGLSASETNPLRFIALLEIGLFSMMYTRFDRIGSLKQCPRRSGQRV